jgi:hypothetical protein
VAPRYLLAGWLGNDFTMRFSLSSFFSIMRWACTNLLGEVLLGLVLGKKRVAFDAFSKFH